MILLCFQGSYCQCHYCKCEKGHIHCKGHGHGGGYGKLEFIKELWWWKTCLGKKYCYGSMEGEYCHCDYCKCKHGFGQEGYGKGCKGHWKANYCEYLFFRYWYTNVHCSINKTILVCEFFISLNTVMEGGTFLIQEITGDDVVVAVWIHKHN